MMWKAKRRLILISNQISIFCIANIVVQVFFKTNLENLETNNYKPILEEIRRQISQWNKRNITVLGRIIIVKALLLSKLTFLILNLPDPRKFL